MLKVSSQVFRSTHSILYNSPWTCVSCRLQSTTTKPQPPQRPPDRRQQSLNNNKDASPKKLQYTPPEPPKEEQTDDGDDQGVRVLKSLSRPLGQPAPPQPGENSGIDTRSPAQRREDFFNYDKHLERREDLKNQWLRPYFRDWTNLNEHKGKTFLAPSRLFRRERAAYFPNLQGYTLEHPDGVADTTNVLRGRFSLVRIFCGRWAEDQTRTFITDNNDFLLLGGRRGGAGLEGMEADGEEGKAALVQQVEVNFEERAMRAWFVRMSVGALRQARPASEWGLHFVVRKGMTALVREHLGMFNKVVGYVYLVDDECRIRWAGCGNATEEERVSLARLARRLVEGGTKKGGENEGVARENGREKP